MSAGLWVVVASVVLAVTIGGWRMYADGRFRGTRPVRGTERDAAPVTSVDRHEPELDLVPAGRLGERATLLQFSSAFCAPCRATRVLLADVAATVPGVVHVELDAEQHLDLVRRIDVRRTPTTLVLDPAGREVARAAGAPRREQVLAALASVTG